LDIIQKRFEKLYDVATDLHYRTPTVDQSFKEDRVWGEQALIQWRVSCESLLRDVFGESHPVVTRFQETIQQRFAGVPPTSFDLLMNKHSQLMPIFSSAKEQYEGGYLFDVQNLVHAEVFSSELEQAEHFLKNKYDVAAAVTAGVVLETTIKKLCTQQSPPVDLTGSNGKGKKTDTLISDLKTAGVYNEAVVKQLRRWMNVRNDAAHGTRGNGEFDDGEIRRMIDGGQDFVAKHMN